MLAVVIADLGNFNVVKNSNQKLSRNLNHLNLTENNGRLLMEVHKSTSTKNL